MAQVKVDEDDNNFLRHALRHGTWERYEHPTKGETLTLQIGNFPILSLHAAMVDGPERPIDDFMNDLKNPMTVALLVSKVARLQEQLQIAAGVISAHSEEAQEEAADHRWVILVVADGAYSVVCSCGGRLNDFLTADAAREAGEAHSQLSSDPT